MSLAARRLTRRPSLPFNALPTPSRTLLALQSLLLSIALAVWRLWRAADRPIGAHTLRDVCNPECRVSGDRVASGYTASHWDVTITLPETATSCPLAS